MTTDDRNRDPREAQEPLSTNFLYFFFHEGDFGIWESHASHKQGSKDLELDRNHLTLRAFYRVDRDTRLKGERTWRGGLHGL